MILNEFDSGTGYLIHVTGPSIFGNYTASCVSVPGCLGYAKTPEEAMAGSVEAIGPILDIWREQGRAIPKPESEPKK